MSARRWKPPYFVLSIATLVSGLLTYGMYESFVVRSVATPANSAATRTVNALDPNGEDTTDRPKELPVWPPPSAAAPADPASNPMQGALPMRIDWPDAAEARPAHSAR